MATTPTSNQLLLGYTVARYRDLAGLTQEQLGALAFPTMRPANARLKINQLEAGQRIYRRPEHLIPVITALGITDPEVIADMELMRQRSNKRGKWSDKNIFGKDLRKLLDLESDADHWRISGSELIPGPLQCPDYARAIFSQRTGATKQQIEQRVEARMARALNFTRYDSPIRLDVILSASCLMRVPSVGARKTLGTQIAYLRELSQREHITIQVFPFETSMEGRAPSEFTLLRIPAPGLAGPLDVGYAETSFDSRIIDDKAVVDDMQNAWSRLTAVGALNKEDTRRFMEQLELSYK